MYYLYEHIRPDTGEVFYVGKGKGRRARDVGNRNRYWHNVVKKAGGFIPVFRAVGLDEELALLAEVELIDQHRRVGRRLCNLTDGGEGTSGRKLSDESRAKIGVRHSQESYDRALKKRMSMYPFTEEHRKNMSLSRTGEKNSMYGKTHGQAAREKISAARRAAPKVSCPHCKVVGDSVNMKRWHFDNCKKKEYEMSKQNGPQIITIDGTEYDASKFNEQQTLLLNHTIDLDRKIGTTTFQLQQLQVGKDSFIALLKAELAKTEKVEVEEVN